MWIRLNDPKPNFPYNHPLNIKAIKLETYKENRKLAFPPSKYFLSFTGEPTELSLWVGENAIICVRSIIGKQ